MSSKAAKRRAEFQKREKSGKEKETGKKQYSTQKAWIRWPNPLVFGCANAVLSGAANELE